MDMIEVSFEDIARITLSGVILCGTMRGIDWDVNHTPLIDKAFYRFDDDSSISCVITDRDAILVVYDKMGDTIAVLHAKRGK